MGASESCDHSNTRKALLQLGSSLGVSLQPNTGCNQRRGCRSPPPLGLATARPRSVDLTRSHLRLRGRWKRLFGRDQRDRSDRFLRARGGLAKPAQAWIDDGTSNPPAIDRGSASVALIGRYREIFGARPPLLGAGLSGRHTSIEIQNCWLKDYKNSASSSEPWRSAKSPLRSGSDTRTAPC